MATVLVTGGAGYFGSQLARLLRDRSEEVRVFDLNPLSDGSEGIQSLIGDICDEEAVLAACAGVKTIYHNVAQVPLAKDSEKFWRVNRRGTEVLLKCAKRSGVENVVYTSSSAVFGIPEQNPVRETDLPVPAEDYGRAKLAGEILCLLASASSGLKVQIVRPRTILGHGRLGIFQILFEWVYQGSNIPVLGTGENRYQFVHSDDLANACLLAGASNRTGVYNCGAEKFGTMREVLEDLCAAANTGSKVKSVPEGLAVGGMKLAARLGLSPLGAYHWLMYGKSMYFDISHAKMELGWQPRFSNSEMMIDSYRYYLEHRTEILAGANASPHQSAVRQKILGWVPKFL